MDVSSNWSDNVKERLLKSYALGKKFIQLKESISSLYNKQTDYYVKNTNVSNRKSQHQQTSQLSSDLILAEFKMLHQLDMANVEIDFMKIEHELLDLKLDFFELLKNDKCCNKSCCIENK